LKVVQIMDYETWRALLQEHDDNDGGYEDQEDDIYGNYGNYGNRDEEEEEDEGCKVLQLEELNRGDRDMLLAKFGSRNVEEVRTLTRFERGVFANEDFVSSDFCIQFLYKVELDLVRDDFRQNIKQLFVDTPELRASYLRFGVDQKRYKVIIKTRCPTVKYQSMNFLKGGELDRALRKYMAKDREVRFDLEKDVLVRISVIRTGDDEYAVLVTESRLVADAWKEADFLRYAFGIDSSDALVQITPKKEATFAASDYWSSILDRLHSMPRLPRFNKYPGRYRQQWHYARIDSEMQKLLVSKSFGNRDMMMSILHTAWGMMQKQVNYGRDTYMCLIMSDNMLSLENSSRTASCIYPIPVRLSTDDDPTIKELVGRQLRQTLMSRSMACASMRDVMDRVGEPEDSFPLYIFFHGFLPDKKPYSKTGHKDGCRLVDLHTWDAGQTDLALYFDMNQDAIDYTFVYNPFCFDNRNVQSLAKFFEIGLSCVLLLWDEKVDLFEEVLQEEMRGWDKTFDTYIL